jgi:hypothetical protein
MSPHWPGEETAALPVCPDAEVVTLFCAFCKKSFHPANRRQRFCTPKCRVDAHREPQRAKHRRWDAARLRDKTLEFDGRYVGPIRNMGPLAYFEKREHNA